MSSLVRSGLVLTIAVGVANVLNAAFQFSLARIFEPDEYALLAALFAVVIVAAIPPLAFQATTAREVAAQIAQGNSGRAGVFLKGMTAAIGRWSIVLSGLSILVYLAALLIGSDEPLAYGATVLTVAAALMIPVVWGGLQGTSRFSYLSGMHVLFAGSRLAAGLAIALAGGSVAAVMVGVMVATVVTELVSFLPIRRMLPSGKPKRVPLATRLNAGAALGLTALWALMYSDVVIARIAFAGDEAGAYAAAAVASKVLLLVPIAATTVLFPRVAALADPKQERRYLVAGLGGVAAASAALAALAWIFAGTFVDLLFGSEYAQADSWLGPLCLAMALYGLTLVFLYHFLALGRARFAVVLTALLAGQIAAYALFHDSPADLVGVQIAFAGITVVGAGAWYLRGR